MLKNGKLEGAAEQRLKLLSPLLDPRLDKAKLQKLKLEAAENSGLSERTIRRYLKAYQENGFDGLRAKPRGRRRAGTIPESVLSEAALLRREVPGRSVTQIISILEDEGLAKPGVLKRSTLQDFFLANGLSSRQLRLYESVSGRATRRFQRVHRNELWQSDIKFGSYLPIGPGGKMQQCYLVAFLDDATRFIVHAEFYATLEQSILEDAFRAAIIKWGKPVSVYFDNGKQYRIERDSVRGRCRLPLMASRVHIGH
jgi:hypothetical protein